MFYSYLKLLSCTDKRRCKSSYLEFSSLHLSVNYISILVNIILWYNIYILNIKVLSYSSTTHINTYHVLYKIKPSHQNCYQHYQWFRAKIDHVLYSYVYMNIHISTHIYTYIYIYIYIFIYMCVYIYIYVYILYIYIYIFHSELNISWFTSRYIL